MCSKMVVGGGIGGDSDCGIRYNFEMAIMRQIRVSGFVSAWGEDGV